MALIIGLFLFFNIDVMFRSKFSADEIYKMKRLLLVAIINLALSFPLNIFRSIITAHERFIFLKTLNLITTVLSPVAMVCVLFGGYRSFGMILVAASFNILNGLINIFYCFKILKIKIIFTGLDKLLLKEIFNYSFFIFLSTIGYQIYWNTDPFIIGIFAGAASIAVYNIGSLFNTYFTGLSNAVSGLFMPKLTKMVTIDTSNKMLMPVLIKVGRIQMLVAAYIFTCFILFGRQFIARWVGSNYNFSYTIAIIFMVPQIISIIQSLFATMLEAMNMHRVKAMIYVSVAILNLIMSIIFIQIWGIVGCALGTAFGMVINFIANNIYYKYKMGLHIGQFWSEIAKIAIPCTCITILFAIILNYLKVISYQSLFLGGIAYTIAFFVTCWCFCFNNYEKKLVISPFKKFIKLN
jgi:O-antigen/teichoic acid export membrane protein